MNFKDQARHHQLILRRHAAERIAAAHAAEAARAAHAQRQPATAQNSAEAPEAQFEQPAPQGPLRRFNRQQAGSRHARRGGGADHRTAQVEPSTLGSDSLQPIDPDGGLCFGSGHGSFGGDGDQQDSNPKERIALPEADKPTLSEGSQAMADIVSAYVAQAGNPANGATGAHGGMELARTLIALRDSQAQHADKAPLNHAVLRVVREFLSAGRAPADLPIDLAGVRDLLAPLTPRAVTAEDLRYFHLKLPLVLLNLRRPRREAERTGARASIAALLSRSAL